MTGVRSQSVTTWLEDPAPITSHRATDRAQWRAAYYSRTATLRFWRSEPGVSLGAFEAGRHALRLGACRARGLPIVRRISGGGAWYLDPDQLGWTLALPKEGPGPDPGSTLAHFAAATADALATLGIPATAAAPDTLEVAGCKLGALALRAGDGVLLVHGTLLLAADVATMLQVLRVPKEKLTPEGLAGARQRMATVAEWAPAVANPEGIAPVLRRHLTGALGQEAFGARPYLPAVPPEPPLHEPEAADLEAFHQADGGIPRAGLTPTAKGDRVARATLSGNLQLTPPDLATRLTDHLAGTTWAELPERVRTFLAATPWQGLGLEAEDLIHVFTLARDRLYQQGEFGLSATEANTLMVHDPINGASAAAILDRAEQVLVPYCAKPPWCKWRNRDGCPECGQCEVGEVYRIARERGLPVTTVTHFEHLQATLGEMSHSGRAAYVGMCCSSFFLKREYAFREAGMPALLLDISGANCYELGQEELAYRGEFTAQAELNSSVVHKVLPRLPHQNAQRGGY